MKESQTQRIVLVNGNKVIGPLSESSVRMYLLSRGFRPHPDNKWVRHRGIDAVETFYVRRLSLPEEDKT